MKLLLALLRSKKKFSELCQAEIKAGLEAISTGNWQFRFKAEGKEKLSLSQHIFNALMDNLAEKQWQLSEKEKEEQLLLAEIEEAWAMTDKEGKILKANPSFTRLFESLVIEGKYCWQVIRSTDFLRLWEEFRRTGDRKEGEIWIAQRPFLARIFYLKKEADKDGKIALLLRDISPEKNLEKIKRELVAHISHELRTPLTIIKGYLETLEEEKLDEVSLSFIARIKDNVDRLERLVRDLLTLEELESQQELVAREKVNLEELVRNVISQFENVAKEKNLFLRLELPAEIPSVWGDAFRLEQMLTNLVDNALKYTDKGGVTIRLEKGEKEVLITVQDTGIGIAPEHLGRIFERFYVVDRSRSRKFGGTGLGLSIVKHIVLLHGGKIEVKSSPGSGSTFTVSLPI